MKWDKLTKEEYEDRFAKRFDEMIREVTTEEREACLFILGYWSACKIRGFHKTFPRSAFNGAVDVALHIIWKQKRIGMLDEAQVKTMVNIANMLGMEQVQPE